MKLQWQVKEAFMPLAIIGAGAVGATLGQAWLKHGQDVIWGVRNPADPKYAALAKERVKAPAEAVKEAEIVVIATPWSATQAAVKSLGSLAGKIVIDCTNPLGMGPDELQLVLGFDTSAGEHVACLRLQDPQHHRCGQYGQGRRISSEAAHAGGG
jgi:predicted dinucleotide-binding enzyme